MKIQIDNNQKRIKIDKRIIRKTIITLLKQLDCADKEISLSFVNDEIIQDLNNRYRNKNKPTDVLSFSLQEGDFSHINPDMLGDIVISVDTAAKNAFKVDLSLDQEINFLIIHGLLHLLGYNHEKTTPAEARKMRKKEKELFILQNRTCC
ncbi:MAG: rRNA maturation RNase YbeY [Deltaproteobacteria bacterium HGW-Deltaproteobacteria-10]|nr:MAG: rRNA maturation RNase YbeY [Deltaproteobacteria bacterium HGW-Deltaproteobacteria-10]